MVKIAKNCKSKKLGEILGIATTTGQLNLTRKDPGRCSDWRPKRKSCLTWGENPENCSFQVPPSSFFARPVPLISLQMPWQTGRSLN